MARLHQVLLCAFWICLMIPQFQCRSMPHRQILRVHLVPHSHDDVGWLRTIDEYYHEQVFQIYDNVLKELWKEPKRRFIVVEQAYFQRWFADTTDDYREKFRQLLSRGQVEFVGGGWVVNDEASVVAESMITQLQVGRSWLNHTFGIMPRVGYQIDPFGHSSGVASIYAQMGYEAVILNRIHFAEKKAREANGTMEFLWNGRLLAHILDWHYSSPPGCDFEVNPPIKDKRDLMERARRLTSQWRQRSHSYPQQKVFLQLIGDDFRFINAARQFENWDLLISYINANKHEFGVEVQYSTLSEYFGDLNAVPVAWTDGNQMTLKDDFFPYADIPHAYWTGYFVSKGWLKSMVRQMEHLLRFAELSTVQLRLENPAKVDASYTFRVLDTLRKTVGEMQHHDAITGTSTRRVTEMYRQHIMVAAKRARELLLLQKRMYDLREMMYDQLLTLNFDDLPVVIYNSMMTPVHTLHMMPVKCKQVTVFNALGHKVPSQLIPDISGFRLYFPVEIHALGQTAFQISRSNNVETITPEVLGLNEEAFVENSYLALSVKIIGRRVLMTIHNKETGHSTDLNPTLAYYHSHSKMTGPNDQPSGAYIFRTDDAFPVKLTASEPIQIFRGPVLTEIRIVYTTAHSQRIRLSAHSRSLEIENRFETIPSDTEVVLQLGYTHESSCEFYTDANGQWPVPRTPHSYQNSSDPAASMYPVSLFAYIQCPEKNQALKIVPDRPLSCGMRPGHMECMLHRRTTRDDRRGVGEPLNDVQPIHPTIHVSFGSYDASSDISPEFRNSADLVRYPPLMMIGRVRSEESAPDELPSLVIQSDSRTTSQHGVILKNWRLISAQTLVDSIEQSEKMSFLLRIQQLSPSHASIRQVIIATLHSISPKSSTSIHHVAIEEMELSGVHALSEMTPKWKWSHYPVPKSAYYPIRTFRILV